MNIDTVVEEWRNLRDGEAFDREVIEDALTNGGKRVRDLLLLMTIDPRDYTGEDIALLTGAITDKSEAFTEAAFRRAAHNPRELNEDMPALLEEMGERLEDSTPLTLCAYLECWHGDMAEGLRLSERARAINPADTLASQVIILSRIHAQSRHFGE